MKTAGIAAMGAAAVIFLTALLLLTAGHFSLLWVILLVVSPFVFILGVPFATGSGPEYLPTDPKLAQQAREARDAELGLDSSLLSRTFEAGWCVVARPALLYPLWCSPQCPRILVGSDAWIGGPGWLRGTLYRV